MIETIGNYGAPKYDSLHTTVLKSVKHDLEHELKLLWSSWEEIGYKITSDGWTRTINKPLLNILCVFPKRQYFLKSINMSGKEKFGVYIAKQIMEAIHSVDIEKLL